MIFTSDGKEYLTPSALEKELISLVNEHGGRITLHNICGYLNLNIDVVEQTSSKICQSDLEWKIVSGSVVTPVYTDSITEEISEILSDQGILGFADLTTRYGLPLDFIKDTIYKRMQLMPEGCQVVGNYI